LGDICTFEKGRGYSKADIREEGTPLVLYGRLYAKYESLITGVDTFAKPKEGSLYSRGYEVVVPASGETAEDIAVASHIGSSGMLLGGDLNVVTPPASLDPTFLAMGITYGSPHGQLAKRAQGKSVVHIHNEDIADIEFGYPGVTEQRKIASTMLCLDNLITLHQRKPHHSLNAE
jgi:type I restriction enzyme S subunit